MWMWQLVLWEIRRSLPCVVFRTSSNVVLNRFLPCSESMCVSVIANDRSESSLITTKPVCITSCQLIKIRSVSLFLKKKKRGKQTWILNSNRIRNYTEKQYVLALSVAEIIRVWKRNFILPPWNYNQCNRYLKVCHVSIRCIRISTVRQLIQQ